MERTAGSSLRRRGCVVLAALLVLVLAMPVGRGAEAAGPVTRTWTGAGANSLWTNNANWNPAAPNPGDILVFPAVAARKANTNDFPAFTTFEQIRVEGGGYTLAGATLQIANSFLHDPGIGTNSINLVVSGPGSFTHSSGTLNLGAANSFDGPLFVEGGLVRARVNGALGEFNNFVDVTGGTLALDAGVELHNELRHGGPGTRVLVNGDAEWAGPVKLFNPAEFDVDAGHFRITGVISGSGTLRKTGPGRLSFGGANTYTGITEVREGVVLVDAPGELGSEAAGTVVYPGATLEVDSAQLPHEFVQVAGQGHEGGGALRNNGGVSILGNVITGGNAVISVPAGRLRLGNGIDAGAAGHTLTKIGAGTLEVEGAGDFDGTLAIAAGTVSLRGDFDGAAVLQGGTLSGDGSAGSVSGAAGTLAPGIQGSPAQLRIKGALQLSAGATFLAAIDGAAASSVRVDGPVSLGGAALSLAVGAPPPAATELRLVWNDGPGPIVGTFAGIADGAAFTSGGHTFRADYRGGPGAEPNDFVIASLASGLADVVVTLQPLPAAVAAGGQFEAEVRVWNAGTAAVHEVSVRVGIPAGALVTQVVGFAGGSCYSEDAGRATRCVIPALLPGGPGEFLTMKVRFVVNTGAGATLALTAEATHDAEDANPANNATEATVTAGPGDGRPFKLRLPGVTRDAP